MTSFLDRLLGRTERAPRTAKAVTDLGPWATGIPLSSMANTPQEKAAAFLKAYRVGWFHKAGSKISRDVASLDWSVSEGDAEEGDSEATLARPDLRVPLAALPPIDQFQRLLERPNPSYTGRQLLQKTQVRLDFAGAAAWYLEGAQFGLPTAIYGISPARMWPSYDRSGRLIGWVMDRDAPSGGVPFDKREILWFTTGNAEDDDIWGTSVVEAVYAQIPLSELAARHTANVLTTGGRLAGMLWPKDRALGEDEFLDAQRAWRNVSSDPNAGKRLLIFPEPMEYAAGASTPAEIGIPELAILNRDEILTAFPISPYQLGVPTPGGLNSGEVRREDRRDYWEGTIHPRADMLEETIQVGLVSLYEEATGQTYDFEIEEPNLDDAPNLIEKVGAYKGLVSVGFDPKEAVSAVGLEHIKWLGLPAILDPAQQLLMQQDAQAAALQSQAGDTTRRDNSTTTVQVAKSPVVVKFTKAREDTAQRYALVVADFFEGQFARLSTRLREVLPSNKTQRAAALKAPDDWWDAGVEDAALQKALHALYIDASKGSLQIVADALERIVPGKSVGRVLADLQQYGAQRIADINANTLQAIVAELSEGTRRGYSIPQLIEGVPSEGYKGVKGVTLDNGVAVFGDARAEMIARTETMLSYNRAALDGYKEFNVRQVTAIDGDHDYECAVRNGSTFDVDEAMGIADHPNGTLDWIPVVDKAAHEPLEVHVHNHPAAVKVEPTEVNVTLPPITVEQPVITVQTPDIHLPEPAPVNVKVEPAQVNVSMPPMEPFIKVEVPEQPVTVTLPETIVNVEAPRVEVNVPEQPAPDIYVDISNG